jgi:hypothetical protein
MMNANQGLLVCDTVLARLDAALDLAALEVACSTAAEMRIRSMVSRLLGDDRWVIRRECSSQQQAKENMASEYGGVFKLVRTSFCGLGEANSLGRITAQGA